MTSNLNKRERQLRKNSTEVEKILWNRPRSRQIVGTKFRRKQSIGNFIVDFVSFEKRIVVELDGGHHAAEHHEDEVREGILHKSVTLRKCWYFF